MGRYGCVTKIKSLMNHSKRFGTIDLPFRKSKSTKCIRGQTCRFAPTIPLKKVPYGGDGENAVKYVFSR